MTTARPRDDSRPIRDAVAEEVAAVAAGDVARYLAILTDDAVFMAPGQPVRQGDELRRWLQAFLKGFRVQWPELEPLAVETVGHLAYHAYSYSWRVTPRAGGEPIEARGKGLHILRRDADGAWRIAREIWNASPAPAEGP